MITSGRTLPRKKFRHSDLTSPGEGLKGRKPEVKTILMRKVINYPHNLLLSLAFKSFHTCSLDEHSKFTQSEITRKCVDFTVKVLEISEFLFSTPGKKSQPRRPCPERWSLTTFFRLSYRKTRLFSRILRNDYDRRCTAKRFISEGLKSLGERATDLDLINRNKYLRCSRPSKTSDAVL